MAIQMRTNPATGEIEIYDDETGQVINTVSAAPAAPSGNTWAPTSIGGGGFDEEAYFPPSNSALANALTTMNTQSRERLEEQAAAGTGELTDSEAAWRDAYLKEHGGVPPRNWEEQRQLRDAAQIWAAQHGSSYSWGNKPGDNRVPLDIWKRLGTVSRSGDVGPLGPSAWGQAADDLGGAYLASRGINYHPNVTGTAATSTKSAILAAILGALRK